MRAPAVIWWTLDANGSVFQVWAIDRAPIGLQMAVESAHLYRSNSCVPVTSPGLKLKGGECEERTLRRSQIGQVWLELQSQ